MVVCVFGTASTVTHLEGDFCCTQLRGLKSNHNSLYLRVERAKALRRTAEETQDASLLQLQGDVADASDEQAATAAKLATAKRRLTSMVTSS